MINQTTLRSAVETEGIGLHTAVPVHLRLLPAPPDTGYVFRRTDLGGFEIPATVESELIAVMPPPSCGPV